MQLTRLVTVFIICILFVQCTTDTLKSKTLNGHWDMKYAELNGQPAPALERIYFVFDDKNLTTNFNETTTDETTPFDVKDGTLIKKSEPKVEFNIKNMTDSTLEMTTELRGFDFKLVLSKAL